MSVERIDPDRIRIVDRDGDRFDVHRYAPVNVYAAVFLLDDGVPVGIDHADGLALLSFLADALGVERYVPDETVERRPQCECGCSACRAHVEPDVPEPTP